MSEIDHRRCRFGEEEQRTGSRIWLLPKQKVVNFSDLWSPNKVKNVRRWKKSKRVVVKLIPT